MESALHASCLIRFGRCAIVISPANGHRLHGSLLHDGERVLTSQIYPNATSRGIELFSSFSPSTLTSFKVWPLASIWQ
jgi:hypothetical protein